MARHRMRPDRHIGLYETPDALQTKSRGAAETMWAMFSRWSNSRVTTDRRTSLEPVLRRRRTRGPLQPINLRRPAGNRHTYLSSTRIRHNAYRTVALSSVDRRQSHAEELRPSVGLGVDLNRGRG